MKTRHTKAAGFGRCLGILAAVYAILIAAGAGLFWNYLKHYEQNHPVGAMNAYFSQIRQNNRDTILADSEFPFDAINTREVYWAYLTEKYAGGDRPWQYAEMPEQDGKTVYDVYADNQRYGTLVLDRQADGWHVRSDYTLQPVTVIAAGEPRMNGADLTAYRTAETPVDAFAGAGGTIPTTGTYSLSCLSVGSITLNHDTAPVILQSSDGTRQVHPSVTEADRTALSAFGEKAARTYAAYISSDAPWAELSALLESGTDFSRQVKAYSSYYYNKHRSIDFQNLQVKEPVAWSPDAFTVEVSFDFVVSRTYDSHTYPTAYRIACRRHGNGFAVANIQTL